MGEQADEEATLVEALSSEAGWHAAGKSSIQAEAASRWSSIKKAGFSTAKFQCSPAMSRKSDWLKMEERWLDGMKQVRLCVSAASAPTGGVSGLKGLDYCTPWTVATQVSDATGNKQERAIREARSRDHFFDGTLAHLSSEGASAADRKRFCAF